MSGKRKIYADVIADMHFVGGMVRMDLATVDTTEPVEEGKGQKLQSERQIIISPDGFIKSFNNMQALINKLIEAGVMKKNEPEEGKTEKEEKKKEKK